MDEDCVTLVGESINGVKLNEFSKSLYLFVGYELFKRQILKSPKIRVSQSGRILDNEFSRHSKSLLFSGAL